MSWSTSCRLKNGTYSICYGIRSCRKPRRLRCWVYPCRRSNGAGSQRDGGCTTFSSARRPGAGCLMASNERLDDLLTAYEERRQQGESIAPEELCSAHPELLDEFKRCIAALDSMNRLLEGGEEATEEDGARPIIAGFE